MICKLSQTLFSADRRQNEQTNGNVKRKIKQEPGNLIKISVINSRSLKHIELLYVYNFPKHAVHYDHM